MTGDEVRGTNAWVAMGYSTMAVNEWLDDVATCLDAGVRPTARTRTLQAGRCRQHAVLLRLRRRRGTWPFRHLRPQR